MKNTVAERMDQFIKDFNNMTVKEQQNFLKESHARAKHILDENYNEDRDFRIIGEELFEEKDALSLNCSTQEAKINLNSNNSNISMSIDLNNTAIINNCSFPWAA